MTARLTSIFLENVRGFSGPQPVPIKPLTLLYGPNSAGKSTILRFFSALADAVQRTIDEDLSDKAVPLLPATFFRLGTEPEEACRKANSPDGPVWVGMGVECGGLELCGAWGVHSSGEIRHAKLGGTFLHPALELDWITEARKWTHKRGHTETLMTDRVFPNRNAARDEILGPIYEVCSRVRYLPPLREDVDPGESASGVTKATFEALRALKIEDSIGSDSEGSTRNFVNLVASPDANDRIFDLGFTVAPGSNEVSLRAAGIDGFVNIHAVGTGVRQVLPILSSLEQTDPAILVIEQPELHLHPRLQTQLGDVLLRGVKRKKPHTVIIETHSEHILRRIMRRMRESAIGKSNYVGPIAPSDISVLYVSNECASSTVDELRLDKNGTLLDPWPGGFFEEGFNEQFA